MSEIFVVWGTCGEYSDRMEWMVCAYRDKAQAETHATLANVWSNANHADHNRSMGANRPVCPFDPHFKSDYTGGSEYSVAKIELREAIPSYEVHA